MLVSQFGHFTATRRTLQETFLYQERFIDFFHCARVFTESGRDGGQTHRTSVELIDNGRENLVVDFIQAITVDVQGFERISGYFDVDTTISFYLCKVADTTEQGIGDTRGSSAS